MLNFAGMDAPALLLHDSFILHNAYGESGEVEKAMRRADYEKEGVHISKIDEELLTWFYCKSDADTTKTKALDIDAILSADAEYRSGDRDISFDTPNAKYLA